MVEGGTNGGADKPPTAVGAKSSPWAWLVGKIGKLPAIVASTVAVLGGLTVLYTTYVRPAISPPKLTVRATCQNHMIRIEVANSGGRSARIGPPTFNIHSSMRPNNPLDLRRYLTEDPGEDGIIEVASDNRGALTYRNPLDFFSDTEGAGNSCRIDISLPVEGRDAVPGSCRCDYIR